MRALRDHSLERTESLSLTSPRLSDVFMFVSRSDSHPRGEESEKESPRPLGRVHARGARHDPGRGRLHGNSVRGLVRADRSAPVDGVNLRSQMAFYVESRRKCGTISSTPLMSSVHLNQMNREARGAGLHRLPELPRQPQKVKPRTLPLRSNEITRRTTRAPHARINFYHSERASRHSTPAS